MGGSRASGHVKRHEKSPGKPSALLYRRVYNLLAHMRPKIDIHAVDVDLRRHVHAYARENGVTMQRAWAEVVAAGLEHLEITNP